MQTTPVKDTHVILDFQHCQAAHCESGATASLLRHHGLDISEPMAFGIGGGLFFGYFPFIRMAHIRITTFRKAPGAVVRAAFRRVGMPFGREAFWSRSSGQRRLDQVLDQGRPVICQVGLFWLPYMPRALRSHFNGHHIVVYGRDDGRYLISEPGIDHVVTLSREELERARFSRGGMNPHGRMYWLHEDPRPRSLELSSPILAGIRDVCFYMLTPPVPLLGVRGIRFLARDLRRWKQRLPEDEVRNNLNQIVLMQEVVGSGGAGFRYMYAAFLSEAAEVLESPELAEASREMTAIGDQWRAFAVVATRFVKGRPDPGDNYAAMAGILDDLASREQKLYRGLRDHAKQRRP